MKTIKSSTPAATGTKWAVGSHNADRGEGYEYQWVKNCARGCRVYTLTAAERLSTDVREEALVWLAICRFEAKRMGDTCTHHVVRRIPPPKPRRSARNILSEISGILCDAGDVPVEPYPEAVRTLVRQRDSARADLQTAEKDIEVYRSANLRAVEERRVERAAAEAKYADWKTTLDAAGQSAREAERLMWEREFAKQEDRHTRNVAAAVRERTEAIMVLYDNPRGESEWKIYAAFRKRLRDLRDWKVTT